ncbi:putative transmembrane subunit of a hydrogenase [Methanococcus vannielii SB]|jgi:energy-converting hydrogenase A subunit H|uniref:Transmembrane subunit of a hydrogenase n=1 Tax=Methanococcus vannielii (strain ATCC 35089 / DSM 1224 / JCM 13029 / OCM 148 / SB) TaxID=406327 RepID=A6UQA0_METVS|nr:proton-conducting transporter membrane subunit [Methanococcus vannielii]ABR54672.1 putative transmembrane subunit of a hydrogenase [Methanococcus vannielii SB]
MLFESIAGNFYGIIPLGDIIFYLTDFSLIGFVVAMFFTCVVYLTKPEKQLEAQMYEFGDKFNHVTAEELRVRKFMSIVCGVATAFSMLTGDLFNFALFLAVIGISNIGIVSAVKKEWVLNAAFHYGIIAMISSLPLFGAAALILGKTGTLSIFELSKMSHDLLYLKILYAIGMIGETGVAPFYAAKAEMFRAPGAPYILMIHLSSLLVIVRTVEILLTIS